MTWESTDITNLLLDAKGLGSDLATIICQKLDLGRSIDKDIEYLYFVSNIVFAITYATDDTYEDTDYDLLAEDISRIKTQRNKFR